MDELGAESLAQLDAELQIIKHKLCQLYPGLDLTRVMPIGERILMQYGKDVSDSSSLRQIMRTNIGYNGCKTPKVEVSPGRFIPAVQSRIFEEDIPYGLCVLRNMADILGFPVPRITWFIEWHQQFMGKRHDCGFHFDIIPKATEALARC